MRNQQEVYMQFKQPLRAYIKQDTYAMLLWLKEQRAKRIRFAKQLKRK